MTSLVTAEPAAPPVPVVPGLAAAPDKGLRAGALGLISSVVIAVS